MNIDKEIEACVEACLDRLCSFVRNKQFRDWARTKLMILVTDVSKVVRDATLRHYEAKRDNQPMPEDLKDLPLFKEAKEPRSFVENL